MDNCATIQNFKEYSSRLSRVSDADLASEYIDLRNMSDADVTNGYAVEIMNVFYDIVVEEIVSRFINVVSDGDEK